jgi:hypothetical protein
MLYSRSLIRVEEANKSNLLFENWDFHDDEWRVKLIFWDAPECSLLEVQRRFVGKRCLPIYGSNGNTYELHFEGSQFESWPEHTT